MLKIFFREPVFVEQRAKQFLPGIRDAHVETWRKNHLTTPEQLNGLNLEAALKLLSKLRGEGDAAAGGRHVRNATYFVSLGEKQSAVVKRIQTRSVMGEGRVYQFTNKVKYEILAFRIDRYLGTNVVPPAIKIDNQTVAQLMIRASPISLSKATENPAALMDMSHVRLIDVMVSNGDRDGPDNLLEGDGGKSVGIDFDLASPNTYWPLEAAEVSLRADGLLLEPGRKLGKTGVAPGVFAKSVVEKLRAFDRAKLLELAADGEITLNENEINSILSARSVSLKTIESWQERYGSSLIVIP